MSTIETINLNIDEKAYSYAKIYASLLNDEFQRKRAYASIVGLYAFINLLEQKPCNLQKSMTLFRNPQLNEQYEISDIYLNNWHLDVRVMTDGDSVLVPRVHYEEEITPDFYIVVKVDKELKHAELVGIADVKDEKDEPFDYNYRKIPISSLISYEEFLNRTQKEKPEHYTEEDHAFFNENYLGIMDNDIDKETKNRLIKLLFNCNELRTEFCCFTGFEMVSCNSSKYDDLFNDHTLGIIGANDVNEPKYEGKEEVIDISDSSETLSDEPSGDSDKEEETEETVSDILDELFGAEEESIAPAAVEEKPVETIVEETNDIIDEAKDVIPDDIIDDSDEIQPVDSDLEFIDTDSIEDNLEDFEDEKDNLVLINGKEDDVIEEIGVPEPENNTKDNALGENVQKVIIGYDEFGEPEYSYITNVDQDEPDVFADIDAEPYPEADIIEDDLAEEQAKDEEPEIQEIDGTEYDTDTLHEENEISEIEETEDISKNPETDEETVILDNDNTSSSSEIEPVEEIEEYPQDVSAAVDAVEVEEVSYKEEIPDNQEVFDSETVDNTLDEEDTKEYDEEEAESNTDEETEETGDETEEEGGEYEDYEHPTSEAPEKKSPSKLIVGAAVGILALGLIGGGTMFAINHSKNNNEQVSNASAQEENNQQDMFEQPSDEGFGQEGDGQDFNGGEEGFEGNPDEQNQDWNPDDQGNPDEQNQDWNPEENQAPDDGGVPPLTEKDLMNQQNNNPEGDVNKAMVNTFSQGGGGVSMRGLNWFCATELFTDNAFKGYLQNLDDRLKQNLRNNLMNATETPPNNSVTAKFAVRNDGNLEKVIISNSSGSGEIDDLVLRSINETFEGEKSQILDNSALKSDMYYLKVVIKL